MLESLIFTRDPKQAIRIGRLLIATGIYFFTLFFVYCCISAGLIRSDTYALEVLGAAVLLNVGFYAAIRSGINLRVDDPSFTGPQVTIGVLANSYLVSQAGVARPAFLLGFLVILAFGTLRFRPRQIVLTGSMASVLYGAIIAYEYFTQTGAGNSIAELLQWLVLLMVSPFFALVANHIGSSRHKLWESNERLMAATREHEVALQMIREQATRDELTGVFNRRYMAEALKQESSRTERTHEPFCILMLDVDHFKNINDCVGHMGGDRVLIAVTALISPQLRAIDHFSRHGGEEFLVLMPSTALDDALLAAERIRKCVEDARFTEEDRELSVTLSIGVAEYRAGGSVDATMAEADRALYRAKHNGRNCVECIRTPVSSSLGIRTA